MKKILSLIALALLITPAAAQQDTSRCATVTVSRATAADIDKLLADAECFARAATSATTSQALRLQRARELATRPASPTIPAPAPAAGLVIDAVTADESAGFVNVTIRRPAVQSYTSTNFDLRPGTAQPGSDYVRTSPSVQFAPGETAKTVRVTLVADAVAEPTETFTALIYGSNNVPIISAEATVTITNSAPAHVHQVPAPTIPAASAAYPNTQAAIASNFDRSPLLVPSWGNGAIPASAAPDVVGAFRFVCSAGPVAQIDPIVNPGARSPHLHQFFGNDAITANTTYQSLRTTGNSTCNNQLNRSGYWLPAMMNGRGQVVRPDYVMVYYKRRPKGDPICTDRTNPRYMGECVDLPRGIRFIFGYDMLTGTAPTGAGYFNCQGPGAREGHYRTIVEAAVHCPVGAQLGAVISAPSCWDGVNLDSPNHRSHVAYPTYGDWGYLRCPSTHPKVIPEFLQAAWYSVDDTLDRSGRFDTSNATITTWHFSSDDMRLMGHGIKVPGTTFHTDYWEGWDDAIRARWHAACIDRMLNCSGGDLGDGQQLRIPTGFNYRAEPRLIPVPTH